MENRFKKLRERQTNPEKRSAGEMYANPEKRSDAAISDEEYWYYWKKWEEGLSNTERKKLEELEESFNRSYQKQKHDIAKRRTEKAEIYGFATPQKRSIWVPNEEEMNLYANCIASENQSSRETPKCESKDKTQKDDENDFEFEVLSKKDFEVEDETEKLTEKIEEEEICRPEVREKGYWQNMDKKKLEEMRENIRRICQKEKSDMVEKRTEKDEQDLLRDLFLNWKKRDVVDLGIFI